MKLKNKIAKKIEEAGYHKIDTSYVGNVISTEVFDEASMEVAFYENQLKGNIVIHSTITVDKLHKIVLSGIPKKDNLELLVGQVRELVDSFNNDTLGVQK